MFLYEPFTWLDLTLRVLKIGNVIADRMAKRMVSEYGTWGRCPEDENLDNRDSVACRKHLTFAVWYNFHFSIMIHLSIFTIVIPGY